MKKRVRKFVFFLLIVLILFIASIVVTNYIKEQHKMIDIYAKHIQNQELRIDQLQSRNNNLEKIAIQQHKQLQLATANAESLETTQIHNQEKNTYEESDFNEFMDTTTITSVTLGALATFGAFFTSLSPAFP